MEPETSSPVDTRELFWKARRYRWLALLPVVVALCAAFLYLNITTPVYESAVIIALEDRSPVSPALEPLVQSGRVRESMVEKVTRVKNRVLNRTFLESIGDRLGLMRDPNVLATATAAARKYPGVTPQEYAARLTVASLSRQVSVSPSGATYIKISAKDPVPEQARRLATAVGEGLIEDTRRSTLGQAQARGEFSQDQISLAAEKLRRSEDDLRSYQERVIGQSLTTGTVSNENVELVRELVDASEKEMEQIRERIQSDRATWTARSGSGSPIPDLRVARTQELETRLNGLEASYGTAAARGGGSPAEGQSLLQQIGGARQALLAEYEAAAAGLPGNLTEDARLLAAGVALDRAVLRSIQARKSRLQSLVSSYVHEARSTPREQMELERLRNEVQTNRDLLATLQKEATSARLSEALETSSLALRIEVIEAPQLSLRPVWPDRPKVLGAALLLGLVASVGLIFAAERVGAILRTVEQAEEELGTKVIGTIPRIEGWSRPGSFIQNHWAPVSILAILLLTALVTGVYTTVTSNRDLHPTTREQRR